MAASGRTLESEERTSARESGNLLAADAGGDGEPTLGVWHRRRTGVKVALGLTAVLLVVAACTLLAPAKFSEGGDHMEMQCGTDYKLQNVVHNNLCGQGPDSGDQGIVYNASETHGGKFVRYILVKLNCKSDYKSESSSSNGMHHDFGTIRMDAGDKTDFRFSFFSKDYKDLTLEIIRITFYDLDERSGQSAREYVLEQDLITTYLVCLE
jgi:hypothetical protein